MRAPQPGIAARLAMKAPAMIRNLLMSALLLSSITLRVDAATPPTTAAPATIAPAAALPCVQLRTTQGDIVVELDPVRAPKTVANFIGYVNRGFYDGLIFHRVIAGFMAQAGGYDTRFEHREAGPGTPNEADNGLKNLRGSIALARDARPHSGTSEFYINLVDNGMLDSPNPDGWGYTVFGRVISGMDVVDKIAAIPTGRGGPFPTDVPQQPVVIMKATQLSAMMR